MTYFLGERYSKTTEPDLRFDLWAPDVDDATPIVFFVHGYGTQRNSVQFNSMAADLKTNEIAWCAMDYQIAPDANILQQWQQIFGCIRYVRRHATTYNIRKNKVGIMGSSAGSLNATSVGLMWDDPAIVGSFGGNTTQRNDTQAICGVSAELFDPDLANMSVAAAGYTDAQFGFDVSANPTLAAPWLCQNHLALPKAKTLLVAGALDTDVPIAHSQNLADAMNTAGIPTTLLTNPTNGHGYSNATLRQSEIIAFFFGALL